MLPSVECRWFLSGEVSKSVLDWFNTGGKVLQEKPREDAYLYFAGCATVGVKLRQGKLEIKAQQLAPQRLVLPHDIHGSWDAWIKWSFDGSQIARLEESLLANGEWIAVTKERWLRKYRAGQEPLAEVDAQDRPKSGCNVELTKLTVVQSQQAWYTLGFEAFGMAPGDSATLEAVCRTLFRSNGPPPHLSLSDANAFSYPAWLVELKSRSSFLAPNSG